MYLELDDYPPYSDKNQSFLRHTLKETLYVYMDIPIALHIMIWLLGYPNILGSQAKINSMSQENTLQ